MSMRTIIVVALALTCGASAAVGVSQMGRKRGDQREVETVPVLVATATLPRGSVLTSDYLRIEQWPKGFAPAGVLATLEEATERTVTARLVKGEPLLAAKLAPKDAGRGLASMIPPGMRAFTIQTAHVAAGVGGFILPGNRVDVLLTTTGSNQDSSGGASTTTLLQNVPILAVAQRLDAPDTNVVDPKELRSVTLMVTPNQAAKLDLGMNKGVLHLSLRNPEDVAEADARPATLAQLRFHQEEAPAPGFLAGALKGLATLANSVGPQPSPESDGERVDAQAGKAAQILTYHGMNRGLVQVELMK